MRVYVLPGHGYTDYLIRTRTGNATVARVVTAGPNKGRCMMDDLLTARGVMPQVTPGKFESALRSAGLEVVSSVMPSAMPTTTTTRKATRSPLVNNVGDALRAAGW